MVVMTARSKPKSVHLRWRGRWALTGSILLSTSWLLVSCLEHPESPYTASYLSRERGVTLDLLSRSRVVSPAGSGARSIQESELPWRAARTAIVICDMWDRHWCSNATARLTELAPRMNAVAGAARSNGVLIIHSPSGVVDYYRGHPARSLARSAPRVNTPSPFRHEYNWDPAREARFPIDDSDSGCDCAEKCEPRKVWTRQIDTLEIAPDDAIADGPEVYYLMCQQGITNVIIMGVAANMCVLGRPFGIRRLVELGQNVVLMRDLTDSMYDPDMPPHVSHFRGTELVVEHIEKYWCPTITSGAIMGGEPFRFGADVTSHGLRHN